MENCGSMLKTTAEKLASCCKKVTSEEITEPILGYMVQRANAPCVKAVIFQTKSGLFCSYGRAPWVGPKIVAFEKAKAQAAASSVAPSTPMENCGSMLKSALVVIVLVAMFQSGSAAEKLAPCCTKVTSQEITEPILGYMVQRANAPCVKAVIFQTKSGLFCSYGRAPWVGRKIVAFEKAKAQAAASSVAPSTPVSLLSIITSTASPSSSSTPPSSSSLPASSSSLPLSSSSSFPSSPTTPEMPAGETFSTADSSVSASSQ
ncbi:hypothetical protein PFLUV_G00258620 [Perca fluviatilis]|uniref:Chemokine interleukin-8-like domain-containing protein n=1 Tax=Perca fluviatilis TaxID=8168 RepID=A0A6A5EB39_PERFL|nr:hypothetical protein PFLUV_G00258620 [Perca fluviatilis]